MAKARQINLSLSDFPAGWQTTAPTPVTLGPGFPAFLSCLHFNNARSGQTAEEFSPNFSLPSQLGGTSVVANSEVFVYSSDAAAQSVYGVVTGPNIPGCIQAGLTEEVEKTSSFPRGSVPKVDVTAVPPPSTGGAPASAYMANVSLQNNGQTTTAGLALFVLLASGRALVDVNTVGLFGHTFPPQLASSLVSTVANRAGSSGL